jgi:phosphate transport system substrate-binding protein
MKARRSARYLTTLALAIFIAPLLTHAQDEQSEDTKKSLQAQAERATAIYERGKKAYYTKEFDLSGLPKYAPKQLLTGWVRIHGNNYIADGTLADRWKTAFAKYQPNIYLSYYLPTSAIAFAALYYHQCDVAMGHRPGFYDLLAYQRIKGYDPTEITALTGSFDVPGWESSTAILVNENNPLRGISMEQLDGIFGAERDGGWSGTNFRPDWARGPEKNIRTWGQLGLKGEWANKPITPYGFNPRYNTATDFSDKVMQGGDKWNERLHGLAHIVRPDGTRHIQADQIVESIAKDRYGIAYTRYRGSEPGSKRLAIAPKGGGAPVEHTLDNVQNRSYPLYNEAYFYTNVKPGTEMNPMVKEFLRFVLSQEGQAEVMKDGKYLPLPADVVREQLKKLE